MQSNYDLLLSHSKIYPEIILSTKNEFILRVSKTLNDTPTAPKCYWFILHWFLSNEKMPSISSILHNGKVISDFKEKTDLFSLFLAYQCKLLSNSSVLPGISFHRNTRLNSLSITEKDILEIIKSLEQNKYN